MIDFAKIAKSKFGVILFALVFITCSFILFLSLVLIASLNAAVKENSEKMKEKSIPSKVTEVDDVTLWKVWDQIDPYNGKFVYFTSKGEIVIGNK